MFAGLFGSNSAKGNAEKGSNQQRRLSTTAAPLPAIITKPPFPHPLPHTRLRISCTSDGLVLSGHRGRQHPFSKRVVHIAFGTAGATTLVDDYEHDVGDAKTVAMTCTGCLGIFKLFQETYLLVITSKRHVANYAGSSSKRMYALSGVSAIPLSSYQAAEASIAKFISQKRKVQPATATGEVSDTSTDTSATSSSESESNSDSSRGDVTGNLSTATPLQKPIGEPHEAATNKGGAKELAIESATHTTDNTSVTSVTGLGRWFWPRSSEKSRTATSQLITWSESATPSPTGSTDPSKEQVMAASAAGASVQDRKDRGKQNVKPAIDAGEAENLRLLDARILKEALADFTSGAFFFSHDFDLTSCAQRKWQILADEVAQARGTPRQTAKRHHRTAPGPGIDRHKDQIPKLFETDIRVEEPRVSQPLCQRADRRFWYNRWLSKDLTDVGAFEFATVVMQGYVQRSRVKLEAADKLPGEGSQSDGGSCTEAECPTLEMLVISRRSIERPGLRYQRRGVNSSGGVANFVESEFMLSTRIGQQHHLTSYVQIRGSIPLYWSQSPWSLKPVPVLERQGPETTEATGRHFERLSRLYFGSIHIVNLAEQTGKEGTLVKAYHDKIAEVARPDVVYNDWDFHSMCKGMRYERISKLLVQLEKQVSEVGSLWLMDGSSLSEQKGVFRTNCMDCLDRTNVVQSAFARKYLVTVLEHLGVGKLTSTSQEGLDVAFNNLWANNGDAISREYAGTSALKGDFVRSGKRNWLGQLNDATNSVSRYYQNTVLDFFKQALIDYILGINSNAFLQFSERMQTSDPGEIARLASIRSLAVEAASAAVLTDGEAKIQGWTLLSPVTMGHIRDSAMEEKVVLLTSRALYICSFEYTLQKVQDFVRIPLGQITSIQQGEYILSGLDASARHIEENYGFCIEYLPEGILGRSRSYSVRNSVPLRSSVEEKENDCITNTLKVAFKALRKDLIRDLEEVTSPVVTTSRSQVLDIVDHIRHACEDIGATTSQDEDFVREVPIVSLAEAKAQVGFLDKLNYELKNMIWL